MIDKNKVDRKILHLIQRNEVLRNYYKILFSDSGQKLRFLDLSCGTRTDIREIVEAFGHEWVGVDQIEHKLVIKADVHELPFSDSSFDVEIGRAHV